MRVLDGQVAIVTGCGRMKGLGRGIALALAEAGADVAITDLVCGGTRNVGESGDEESAAGWRGLDSLAEEIRTLGRRVLPIVGDVGDSSDVERIISKCVHGLGQVDILVNNAAVPQGEDRNWAWEVPVEAFDELMRVNLRGVFLMSGSVIRHLLAREAPGRIINISSGAGKSGFPKRAAYCASKFAVNGLTQSMAKELGDHGVTVNSVCPGAIDTARHTSRSALRTQDSESMRGATIAFSAPVPRLGVIEDVSRAVVFLADPAASYITGQGLNVDGGLIMH